VAAPLVRHGEKNIRVAGIERDVANAVFSLMFRTLFQDLPPSVVL